MPRINLFTDGSVDPKLKVGYGAYLWVKDINSSLKNLEDNVKLKRFESTSSTKLELQTLLWALDHCQHKDCTIVVYTDCQNIIGLPERRFGFEKKNYRTGKNKLIKNYLLYQQFYNLMDQLNCQFIKIPGHKPSKLKNEIDQIFTVVDRASRMALRTEFNNK